MYSDFINNYRKQRAKEREERDRQYDKDYQQILRQNTGKIGSMPATMIGLTGLGVTRGLDNVSRGVSDFFSAYKDAVNPGHGKIGPKNNDFFGIDSENYADVKDIGDVDYSRDFALYRKAENGSGSDLVDKIKIGFKNGKIATVSARMYNPETGKEDEYKVYGRSNLANYFKKFYDYDRVYAAKPLDGGNSKTIFANSPNDVFYQTDRLAASELFRPRK